MHLNSRHRERNRSCSLVSRRSRGRIAKFPHSISSSEKNHGLRCEGILKSICKEIALQRPKSGKFDYLSAPGHSAHSMASEFFTDDYLLRMAARIAIPPELIAFMRSAENLGLLAIQARRRAGLRSFPEQPPAE
jgi:hypothetical protein